MESNILVRIPLCNLGDDKFLKYEEQAVQGEQAWVKILGKEPANAATIQMIEVSDEDFWVHFDLEKLKILLQMLTENQDRDCVCAVADADVRPIDRTLEKLQALWSDRLGLGRTRDPSLENSFIAARPSENVIESIKHVLEIMKGLKCTCDSSHHHSFHATTTLLPALLFLKASGSRPSMDNASLCPPCPHNCHWVRGILEMKRDVLAYMEGDARSNGRKSNAFEVPVYAPPSTH